MSIFNSLYKYGLDFSTIRTPLFPSLFLRPIDTFFFFSSPFFFTFWSPLLHSSSFLLIPPSLFALHITPQKNNNERKGFVSLELYSP